MASHPTGGSLVGRRLGIYQVLSLLGIGGMGEVYRAHDTRLGRDVALKVLPPAFTTDPDRLARLEREARALAALNHPNLATLYGVEDIQSPDLERGSVVRALVMELVEGNTLAERIQKASSMRGKPVRRVREPFHHDRQLAKAGYAHAALADGSLHIAAFVLRQLSQAYSPSSAPIVSWRSASAVPCDVLRTGHAIGFQAVSRATKDVCCMSWP
jgi:serine/threonine protein kinase